MVTLTPRFVCVVPLSHPQAGTALPAMPPQAAWKAGSQVEVGWAIEAHQ